MHEATQQLLDGVVGLTCVDSSLHPLISAAPLVGSIIAQQSVYVCHVASASHALLGQGDSTYWHVIRGVAAARERYVASRAPVGPNLAIPSRRNLSAASPIPPEIFSHSLRPMGSVASAPKSAVPPLPEPPADVPLMSPLEFRVVVVGGGRVGRQIVERLLREPTLVHPSRITIITRQPNTVAAFAGRGVLCTGRTEGREALEACHVLIIACQQSQFYDFATIYCPRVHKPKRTPRAAEAAASQRALSATPGPNGNASRKSELSRRRHRRRRTLRDVVDKWRAALDDDSDGDESVERRKGHSGPPRRTALLSPGTIVFSCCIALGPHKIAKEMGHLDPLVVRADVDLRAVHAAAAQFRSAQDAHRDAYVRRVALEDNTFLTMLHSVQQSSPLLLSSSPVPASSSGIDFGIGFGSGSGSGSGAMPRLTQVPLSSAARAPPDMQCALSGDGVSGGTLLLLQVWRALRCIAVVRQASLALAQQRTFTYLQRVGPLLGAALVALPRECQCEVLAALTKELARCDEDSDEDEDEGNRDSEAVRGGGGGGKPLLALERRVVSAYDSDDNGDAHDRSPPHSRELARLVECFPEVFSTEEAALRQLREYYTAVTTPSAPEVV